MRCTRVVVVGLDGFEPSIIEAMMARGECPNLARLSREGGYRRLATTLPAQTPVAWSSFAVGANPGAHGIFDFLTRDPASHRPQVALFRYEQKSRFLPPRAVNLRGGKPVWTWLSEAGVESTVLRHPCTYPPDAPRGRMLAGVGVPDIRGGFGATSWITDAPEGRGRESEHLAQVTLDRDGRATLHLRGPRAGAEDATAEVRLRVRPAEGSVAGSVELAGEGGEPLTVAEGRWSDWVRLRFKVGALQKVHAQVRFHLVSGSPLRLHAGPVQFDPDEPLFPISHPWDYAGELRRGVGRFHTLGMAEDHTGLNNGRITEDAFLAQCQDVLRERKAMMHYELARFDRGLFFCLFDTPDRIQHMFWRFRDPAHPAHRGETPPPEMARVIEDHYRACDGIVGEAWEHAGDDTLFLVASDHGFADFRRAFHLNAWLHSQGYLALKGGVEPGEGAGDLLEHVDWTRTRAYSCGLAGLWLNLKGREAEGIVPPTHAEALKAEIAARLGGLPDPERGDLAVRRVVRREDAYSGPHVERAPDLLLCCAPGYRVSSASAMGGVPARLFEDNLERWSGDHVVDPAAVPGVLFMNRPVAAQAPSVVDLAPTILGALGAPGGETMEGRPLLP
ncbi:MAG: alkaline phosphatase family protein [Longimicrobiales bacterium]